MCYHTCASMHVSMCADVDIYGRKIIVPGSEVGVTTVVRLEAVLFAKRKHTNTSDLHALLLRNTDHMQSQNKAQTTQTSNNTTIRTFSIAAIAQIYLWEKTF